jgi:hypothetical protein
MSSSAISTKTSTSEIGAANGSRLVGLTGTAVVTAADGPGTPAPGIMSPTNKARSADTGGLLALVGLTGFEPATT